MSADDRAGAPPVLHVVRGDATATELAALLAVLGARPPAVDDAAPEPMPLTGVAEGRAWHDPARMHRGSPGRLTPGPDGWRASGLPGSGR